MNTPANLARNLRAAGFRTYWKLEKWITPDLVYSQYRYHQVLSSIVPTGCRWLDLGCGHQMFAEWMTQEEDELAARSSIIVGADLDFEGLKKNHFANLRIMANLETLPVRAASFDLITANMVMEHTEHPEVVLREVHRALAPGGLFVFHTPNRLNPLTRIAAVTPRTLKTRIVGFLEGRGEEDIFPAFYRANSVAEIRSAAEAAGLDVRKIATIRSSAATSSLGPFAIPELVFLRMLKSDRWEYLRACIICVLQKPSDGRNAMPFGALEKLQIQA